MWQRLARRAVPDGVIAGSFNHAAFRSYVILEADRMMRVLVDGWERVVWGDPNKPSRELSGFKAFIVTDKP